MGLGNRLRTSFPNANDPTIQFPNPFATTSTFTGIQSISGLSANFPAERTHQWNFSVGRQILGMAVDIGYVGTRSLRIPYNEASESAAA